jgi:hypothetical protein
MADLLDGLFRGLVPDKGFGSSLAWLLWSRAANAAAEPSSITKRAVPSFTAKDQPISLTNRRRSV